ncbi:MAG: (d)CMP kinase [Thermoplasmatota archaeon]
MVVVTVGGPPGSGTSTLSRLLEEALGLRYVYAGQLFRDKARSMGLTLAEFGELCEKDQGYDRELDDMMMDIARKGDVILEGRMTGPLCHLHAVESFKVYVDANPFVRAERVLERDGGTLEEVVSMMREREESEIQRYREYYDIDPRERKYYDMVIDSSELSPPEELKMVLGGLQRAK